METGRSFGIIQKGKRRTSTFKPQPQHYPNCPSLTGAMEQNGTNKRSKHQHRSLHLWWSSAPTKKRNQRHRSKQTDRTCSKNDANMTLQMTQNKFKMEPKQKWSRSGPVDPPVTNTKRNPKSLPKCFQKLLQKEP